MLPRRRGPQRAHKCTDEILDFVEQWRAASPREKDLTEAIKKRFGISINPRSIERALARRKKNDEGPQPVKSLDQRVDWKGEYENLRRGALEDSSRRGHGLALFVARGMMAWLQALTALGARTPRQNTPPASVDWAPVLQPDLTTLLANLVLNCLGGEEAHEQLQ